MHNTNGFSSAQNKKFDLPILARHSREIICHSREIICHSHKIMRHSREIICHSHKIMRHSRESGNPEKKLFNEPTYNRFNDIFWISAFVGMTKVMQE